MQERVRAALSKGDSSLARNELTELLMASAERMTSILAAVVQHVPTNSPRPRGAFPRRGKVRDHDGR
jgi:phage shock protein A